MQVSDKCLWRSFKIIDKWCEGEIVSIKIKKKNIKEYHIKTNLPGILSIIVRYTGDIKPINI